MAKSCGFGSGKVKSDLDSVSSYIKLMNEMIDYVPNPFGSFSEATGVTDRPVRKIEIVCSHTGKIVKSPEPDTKWGFSTIGDSLYD